MLPTVRMTARRPRRKGGLRVYKVEPGILFEGVTPGGFEMMFAERQGVDAETNRMLMERHNMVVVGPPLR